MWIFQIIFFKRNIGRGFFNKYLFKDFQDLYFSNNILSDFLWDFQDVDFSFIVFLITFRKCVFKISFFKTWIIIFEGLSRRGFIQKIFFQGLFFQIIFFREYFGGAFKTCIFQIISFEGIWGFFVQYFLGRAFLK